MGSEPKKCAFWSASKIEQKFVGVLRRHKPCTTDIFSRPCALSTLVPLLTLNASVAFFPLPAFYKLFLLFL